MVSGISQAFRGERVSRFLGGASLAFRPQFVPTRAPGEQDFERQLQQQRSQRAGESVEAIDLEIESSRDRVASQRRKIDELKRQKDLSRSSEEKADLQRQINNERDALERVQFRSETLINTLSDLRSKAQTGDFLPGELVGFAKQQTSARLSRTEFRGQLRKALIEGGLSRAEAGKAVQEQTLTLEQSQRLDPQTRKSLGIRDNGRQELGIGTPLEQELRMSLPEDVRFTTPLEFSLRQSLPTETRDLTPQQFADLPSTTEPSGFFGGLRENLQDVGGRVKGFISDKLETREEFLVGKQEPIISQQLETRSEFLQTLDPSQIETLSKIQGSGVEVEPITPIGGGISFTLTPTQEEIQFSRERAEEQFGKLPALQRVQKRGAEITIGGVRGATRAAELIVEFPLEGFGGVITKDRPAGFVQEPVVDIDLTPSFLEDRPVGTTGRVAEFSTSVGLPAGIVAGGVAKLLSKGFTLGEVGGEFAQSFSLARVKPGRFVPDQILKGEAFEVGTPDFGVSKIKARGLAEPGETLSGLSISRGERVGGVFKTETPFIEVGRGGRITEGVETNVIAQIGEVGKPGKVGVITGEVTTGRAGFDLFGREQPVRIRTGEEFTQRAFTGFAETLPSGRRARVTGTSLERPLDDVQGFDIGKIKIRQQDLLVASGRQGIDFRTDIIAPTRRLTFDTGRPPRGTGERELSNFIPTSGKKSSKQFLQNLNKISQQDITSLSRVARQRARSDVLRGAVDVKPSDTLLTGPGAFGVLRRQPSEFAGTGLFEKTEEVAFSSFKNFGIRKGGLFDGSPFDESPFRGGVIDGGFLEGDPREGGLLGPGIFKEPFKFKFRDFVGVRDLGRDKTDVESLIPGRPNLLFRSDLIFKQLGGQGSSLKTSERLGSQERLAQSQIQRTIGDPFVPPSFRRGFGRGGGFGVLGGFFPSPGIFEPRRRKVKGKRRLKRTPSVISIVSGFEAPEPLVGEETGLIARPILRKRKKKGGKK